MRPDLFKRSNSFISLIVFLLVFYIPSAAAVGGFQVWYVLTTIVIYFGILRSKLYFDNLIKPVFIFFFLNLILLSVSLLFSGNNFGSFQDFNELLRLLGTFGIFYLAYTSYCTNLDSKILLFFKVFLVVELIFCYLQNYEIFNSYMGLLWNSDRIWDLRRTGSFANPNIVSIFCIATYSYIFFKSKLIAKIIYGIIVFSIILFTSSKTGLISFLIIININIFLVKAKFNIKAVIIFISLLFIVAYIFVELLYMYQDKYPYIAQIISMFENNMDIGEIKSIGDRQVMWDEALAQYHKLSYWQKFFGIGPAKATTLNVIDNEFLTILLKTGIIGCLFYVLYLFKLFTYLFKRRQLLAAKVMISILLLFLLSSGSASTFLAWHLSLMLFLFLGICFKEIKLIEVKNNA